MITKSPSSQAFSEFPINQLRMWELPKAWRAGLEVWDWMSTWQISSRGLWEDCLHYLFMLQSSPYKQTYFILLLQNKVIKENSQLPRAFPPHSKKCKAKVPVEGSLHLQTLSGSLHWWQGEGTHMRCSVLSVGIICFLWNNVVIKYHSSTFFNLKLYCLWLTSSLLSFNHYGINRGLSDILRHSD